MTKPEDRLSWSTIVGFGAGDIYGGGSLMIIGFYYLYFLTDVVLLPPALAGTVILISKIWDAVSDPVMGFISDRTRTRFGRRRPYFLAGIILIFVSFVLLWIPYDPDSTVLKFALVLLSYLFFSTIITMVMVPYNALASELTPDYHERTRLSSVRIFFSSVSSLVCAVAPLEIVKLFPTPKQGYPAMAVVFGLFFALPFLATFFTTRERTDYMQHTAAGSILRDLRSAAGLRPFRHVLAMYLFAFVAMDAVMAVVIYFMTYYMNRPEEANIVLGVLLIVQIASLPVHSMISKRIGKRKAFMAAAVAWFAVMLVSLTIGPDQHFVWVYLFAALVGYGTGGIIIMIYAIFPDIPDVDELFSGIRREGSYSGLLTFLRKFSSAIGLFIISNVMTFAGYLAPVEQVVEGQTMTVNQPQTATFILALRLIFALVPNILLIGSIWFAHRYALTPETHQRLRDFLERRRAGTTDEEEERILQEELR